MPFLKTCNAKKNTFDGFKCKKVGDITVKCAFVAQ